MSDFIDVPVSQYKKEPQEKDAGMASDEMGNLAIETGHSEGGQTVDLAYILKQMETIQKDTNYLHEVINKLSLMTDGDSGHQYAPGNVMGEAKAKAFGDIVRCRETTNQQLLKVYERMYDDISVRASVRQRAYDLVEYVLGSGGMASEDKRIMVTDILKYVAE